MNLGTNVNVVDNYRRLCNEIAEIATRCGRNPNEIKLVVVSKGHDWEEVKPLYGSGCRTFGENRIQEALKKSIVAPDDIEWHFIGTLQKNKVRKAVNHFGLIHSVDTLSLAIALSEESVKAGIVTRILLQVNITGEKSKQGLSSEEWQKAMGALLELPSLKIEGLMTIAPFVKEEKILRDCFSKLRQFRDLLKSKYGNFSELSMGMSNDFRYAIEEGATYLRIGSALFDKV